MTKIRTEKSLKKSGSVSCAHKHKLHLMSPRSPIVPIVKLKRAKGLLDEFQILIVKFKKHLIHTNKLKLVQKKY